MSEPARIGLRLLGFVLLLIGIVLVVILVKPGPGEVAEWMGSSCRHTKNGGGEQCTVFDVLQVSASAPILILIGAVMTLALRPADRGPFTLDLSRLRRR
jgi:hypothetical protein